MENNHEIVSAEIMQWSMAKKRKSFISVRNALIFGVLAFIGYSIWLMTSESSAWIVTLFFAVFLFLLVRFFIKLIPSTKDINELPALVDKMETSLAPSHRRYLFFVKDEKWGVYDYQRYCVVVPAQYDSVSWKTKGDCFVATEGSKSFLIYVGKWNEKKEIVG